MKRINVLCASAWRDALKQWLPAVLLGAGLCGLPACTDDDNDGGASGGDNGSSENYSVSTLDVITDPADMPVTVINYAAASAKKGMTRGVAATEVDVTFTLPTVQTSDYENLPEFNYNAIYNGSLENHDLYDGKHSFKITTNQESKVAFVRKLYIVGTAETPVTFKLTGMHDTPVDLEIFVLSNATLDLGSGCSSPCSIYVYKGGTVKSDAELCTVAGKIYSNGTNSFSKGLKLVSTWADDQEQYSSFKTTTSPFELPYLQIGGGDTVVLNGATLNVKATSELQGGNWGILDIQGVVKTSAPINAANITINGALYSSCATVTADNKFTLNVSNSTVSLSYIKADTVLISNGNLVLLDGGYVEAKDLYLATPRTQWSNEWTKSGMIQGQAENPALINVNTFTVSEKDLTYALENLSICGTLVYGNLPCTYRETVVFYDELASVLGDTVHTGDACVPIIFTKTDKPMGGGDEEDDPDPEPTDPTTPDDVVVTGDLTPIARVIDHTHPISATCVQIGSANHAYVSWHDWDDTEAANYDKTGDYVWGCIEAFQVNTAMDTLKLLAYVGDKEADYNHIFYDGTQNRILVAGHTEKKGGIIGQIAFNDPTDSYSFTHEATCRYTTIKGNRQPHKDHPEFYAGDGNCIIRNGEYLQVASAGYYYDDTNTKGYCGGFSTINNDLSRYTPDAGARRVAASAKHIALTTSGKIVTLNLADKESIDGSGVRRDLALLTWYAKDDYTWATPTPIIVEADDVHVAPVDGKNVVAADPEADEFYVCLGNYGLKRYQWGQPADKNELNYHSIASVTGFTPANGVAVDKQYVYLAAGSGLRIFSKDQLVGDNIAPTPVAEFTQTKPYVRLVDGTDAGDAHGRTGRIPSCNYVALQDTNADGVADYVYLAYGLDGLWVLKFNPAGGTSTVEGGTGTNTPAN